MIVVARAPAAEEARCFACGAVFPVPPGAGLRERHTADPWPPSDVAVALDDPPYTLLHRCHRGVAE